MVFFIPKLAFLFDWREFEFYYTLSTDPRDTRVTVTQKKKGIAEQIQKIPISERSWKRSPKDTRVEISGESLNVSAAIRPRGKLRVWKLACS